MIKKLMRGGDNKQPIPIKELSRYFRVPSRGIAVDYPGREILLASRITNISMTGVFVRTRSPFAKGSKVDIAFCLPTAKRAINALCVVRWSTASDPRERPVGYADIEGMGLEFTRISRRDKAAIELYIQAFLTRMRSPRTAGG
ncbi:MAG: PilZ domain-containing protein [Deltaproteobacteria bacterium]|nr:PilZ domain-containing protein [Deltaproteobacteria bacterium]